MHCFNELFFLQVLLLWLFGLAGQVSMNICSYRSEYSVAVWFWRLHLQVKLGLAHNFSVLFHAIVCFQLSPFTCLTSSVFICTLYLCSVFYSQQFFFCCVTWANYFLAKSAIKMFLIYCICICKWLSTFMLFTFKCIVQMFNKI